MSTTIAAMPNPVGESERVHSDACLRCLEQMRQGTGGGVLCLAGEAGPFSIGVLNAPAQTLLDAILQITGREPYERVVVFTGIGDHLPPRKIAENMHVGREAGGWLHRGTWEDPPAPGQAAPDADSVYAQAFSYSQGDGQNRVILVRQETDSWVKVMERFVGLVESICAKTWNKDNQIYQTTGRNVPRTLLLIDEWWLRPTSRMLRQCEEIANRDRVNLKGQLSEIGNSLAKDTKVDVVLLATSRSTAMALRSGKMLHDGIERFLRIEDNNASSSSTDQQHPLLQSFPALKWSAAGEATLRGVDPQEPHGAYLRGSRVDNALYNALRIHVPSRPLARIRPPADASVVDVAFWARIDLERIKQRMLRDVIGQRDVIDMIVDRLGDFRETCQDALRARRPLPTGADYYPPAFLFMGESGMGKTHLAETLANELFGDGFYALQELTAKKVDDELLGSDKKYIGYDDTSQFLSYSKRCAGMGLLVFDELDKVQQEHSGGLAKSMAAFLNLLERRNVSPKNPNHANHPDGKVWCANTVLVFTANVIESGTRPGFETLESFGTPLLARLRNRRPFSSLESSDVEPAIRQFLPIYVKTVLAELFMEGQIAIEDRLYRELAQRFDAATVGKRDHRSFRILLKEYLPARLPRPKLKEKFRGGQLVVETSDLSKENWNPV